MLGLNLSSTVLQNLPLDWPKVAPILVANYTANWKIPDAHDLNIRADVLPQRKLATYSKYFARPELFSAPSPYLNGDGLPFSDAKRVARFKLGSHWLKLETGRWSGTPWPERTCTRCSSNHLSTLDCHIDDELHLIYDCQLTAHLRQGLVNAHLERTRADHDLRSFIENNTTDTLPYISECMSLVDEAERPRVEGQTL
jgi:hypothetical protein